MDNRRRMFANRSNPLLRVLAISFLMSALAGMFAVWGMYQSAATSKHQVVRPNNNASVTSIHLQKQEQMKSSADSVPTAKSQKKVSVSSSRGETSATVTTNGRTVKLHGKGDVEKEMHEHNTDGDTKVKVSIHSRSNSSTNSSSNLQINVDSSSTHVSGGE